MLDQILYLSRFISHGFNTPKLGSWAILATIDFSIAFTSVWHPPIFRKLISLAPLLALFDELNLSFLTSALAWFFKITKVAPIHSIEVFCRDPLLALFFSLFSPTLSQLLYLFQSTVLFMLTIWPSSPPTPRLQLLCRITQGALIRQKR